jgi:Ca-activated chloride channel family protein
LVTLTLTVTDLYGRFVSGLNKSAFTVFDNNQEQEITFFSDADAPASIGILFDVSDSMSGEKIGKARKALEKFINTSHPADEYFLIGFNSRAQLLLDRTRDGDAVLQKLTLVKPKDNTALYDACYLGVERVTRGTRQKKAMLIISDGQDNASRYNFGEVRRLLKESDVTVYAVGIMDGRDAGSTMGMQGQAFLDELTSVTGGKAFYPQTDVELDEIFERLALELRHQYSIGFTPKDFTPDGKWHKTKVKVKPPRGISRLTVRTRDGYYASPNTNYK